MQILLVASAGLVLLSQAAMQGLQAQQKLSELASWQEVTQTYWRHWAQHHPPLALLAMPGGSVAIVRSKHMLTLLRKSDSSSMLQYQAATIRTPNTALRDLPKLQQCVSLMQDLLGPDVLSLFATLTTMASTPELSSQTICNAFVQVLVSGPQLGGDQMTQKHAARQALLAWRRQRSAAILQLGQIINSMTSGTPVAALQEFLDLLQPQHTHMNTTASSPSSSTAIPGEALTVVLRQAASQQLQASSHLLLIAWLNGLRAAGTLAVSPTVSHVLQHEIVPQLQTHLRRTAISQWLCAEPAAALVTAESNQTHKAQLHQQLASLAFASGNLSQDSSRQHCIGQLLLQDFASQLDGEHCMITMLCRNMQISSTLNPAYIH